MRVFFSSLKARDFCRRGCALTMGNFDGLHLGHQTLIRRLRDKAARLGLPSIVYTFEPHPVRLLAPHAAPPLLNTLEQKIDLIRKTGADALVFETFNRRFAQTTPGDFFEKYLLGRLRARTIIIGYDFTFGAKRKGNIETLEQLCRARGIGLDILKPCLSGETLVSSSIIRRALQEGNVREVLRFLKHPYFIDGRVVRGSGKGKVLGVPTANLEPENELVPGGGVYATRVVIGRKNYGSVTNIGVRPTFGKNGLTIETHIFGLRRRLYGRKMRLFFFGRIRDERRFSSPSDLAGQIRKDIVRARHLLAQGIHHA